MEYKDFETNGYDEYWNMASKQSCAIPSILP